MLEALFTSEKYTTFQLLLYYLGAFSWLSSYILVVRKCIRKQFMDYPILSIAANVIWEALWSNVFPLDFGGIYLHIIWKLGLLLDLTMFYFSIKHGRDQVSIPWIKENLGIVQTICLVISGILIYSFTASGYDLPMGFHSGMILNILMSGLALLLPFQLPNRKFSFWIGFTRFLGTSVFFTIFAFSVFPNNLFVKAMCIITLIMDIAYLCILIIKNRQFQH